MSSAAAPQRVVVVGAGLAGGRTCEELRAQGYAGELVLVGAEAHAPYDRPPLSKEVLAGELDGTALEVDWAALDVTLRLGRVATALRPGVLSTDAGEEPWDAVVLATGARPVTLPGAAGHQVLRTVDHALALRARLVPGARVVVVGAGWVGAEVATTAARAGCRVTVVEGAAAPLAGALGADVGALTVPWYAALGIELRTSCAVATVEPDRVVLASGEELPCDVVLVGVGSRPDTAWLEGSGLAVERGVLVDARLAASWPGVVAVGDCAARESPRYAARLRVEHWDEAVHGPAVAAATVLRPDDPDGPVHDPVPYFWSQQLGHYLQHAGHAAGADGVVHRGEPGDPAGWMSVWLRGGTPVALLAVDRPRDVVAGRRMLAAGTAVDLDRLADPGVPVKDLLARP